MAVTAHYIDDNGFLAEHLIAFRRIHGHHTGANIGQALFEILEEAGITRKASCSFTLLNSFSNILISIDRPYHP